MHPAVYSATPRVNPLVRARDWLDDRGRLAWLAAVALGLVVFWPVGLAILGYMIWSKRMFARCHATRTAVFHPAASTGNVAFDAYRDETLKRLEDEHRAFVEFLARLREAKDKAEFDQFMAERRDA